MPIKPENRLRYPSQWKEIRAEILARAGNACEFCGLQNGVIGHRDSRGVFQVLAPKGYLVQHIQQLHPDVRVFQIVLTIAHMGLPAKLPMHLHMTRTAEANEVFKIVGFFMPLDAESPEWRHMMHRRTLSELDRRSAAVPACFVVSLPSGGSSSEPREAVVLQSTTVAPEAIRLTDWSLLRKPFQAAIIGAEAATGTNMPSAHEIAVSASLAMGLAESSLTDADLLIATGRRTSFDPIGSLLSRQGEASSTDRAVLNGSASARPPTDTGSFGSAIGSRRNDRAADLGTGIPRSAGNVIEQRAAGSALDLEGTLSWTGHAQIYHVDAYPENCDPSNLKALCQRCHLRYDHPHHRTNAAATRRAKKLNRELFVTEE